MNIAFILTRGALYRYKGGAFGRLIRYAPLTIPTLISLIPKELDPQIEIYDDGIELIDPSAVKADLICLTSITGGSSRAYEYARYFKAKGKTVVMGGVHATLMPEEALQHVDSVLTGLGVEIFPQMLRDYASGNLQRRYDAGRLRNFSGFPLPVRECYSEKKSRFITVNSVQATYGCPNRCEFCVTPYSAQGYNHRPVEEVVDEIRRIKKKFFVFVDPSPIEDDYAKELYRAMIPLGKHWASPMTIRIAQDKELLDLAVRSGMKGVLIGFESVSADTLHSIRKNFNSPDSFFSASQRLHKHGVAIMGCFVFGLDSDDKGCFQRTLEFVNKAAIDVPRFTINTAYPGTDFYQKMLKQGRIIEDDWSMYDCQHVVVKPLQMSVEELYAGHHWAWKQAYSSKSIARRLIKSRSFLSYALGANIAYKFYAHSLPKYTREVMCDYSDIRQYTQKKV